MELWHWVLGLALIVVGLGALALAKKGYFQGLSLPGGNGTGAIPDFVMNFAAIILGGAVLGFGLYETRAVWNDGGWLMVILFWVLAGLAIALALTREGTARTISLNLAATACILAGSSQALYILFGCDAACQVQRQEEAVVKARVETERRLAVESVQYPGCNRQKVPTTFSPTWVRINPNGGCAPDLYYVEQVVTLWAKQPGSDKPLGPFHRGDALPLDTEWIMSEGKTFNGFVQLSPPRYTQLFR
ncbi:MAG: hypothetical protein AAB919_01335 [Patescibacteria group bacterium]